MRMVEDVVTFDSELESDTFRYLGFLGERQIKFHQSRPVELIPANVARTATDCRLSESAKVAEVWLARRTIRLAGRI